MLHSGHLRLEANTIHNTKETQQLDVQAHCNTWRMQHTQCPDIPSPFVYGTHKRRCINFPIKPQHFRRQACIPHSPATEREGKWSPSEVRGNSMTSSLFDRVQKPEADVAMAWGANKTLQKNRASVKGQVAAPFKLSQNTCLWRGPVKGN